MRRILVLGGTGWLGRESARQARDSGAEVVCLARGESGSATGGVQVYADDSTPGADETAQLVEPRNVADDPDAKVAAERASAAALGARLLIARPDLIAGPGDPSDRLGCWPAQLRGSSARARARARAPEPSTASALRADDGRGAGRPGRRPSIVRGVTPG